MAFDEKNPARRVSRAGVLLTAVLALPACDILGSSSGRTGELERGLFTYECEINPDDAFCDGSSAREFPAAVAVGAWFRVAYEADDDTQHIELVTGCLDCMERRNSGFVMFSEGRAPLLAENNLGEVYDILHIEAKEASELVVRVDDEAWLDGGLLIEQGKRYDFNVTPQAADGTELGGALDYEWSIEGDSVVEFMSSHERNDVEVSALSAGETTIVVTSGELRFEIPVEVKEAN